MAGRVTSIMWASAGDVLFQPTEENVGDDEIAFIEHHHVRHARDAALGQYHVIGLRVPKSLRTPGHDCVDSVLAFSASRYVLSLHRQVGNGIEVGRRETARLE